jgi:hypothetical protein
MGVNSRRASWEGVGVGVGGSHHHDARIAGCGVAVCRCGAARHQHPLRRELGADWLDGWMADWQEKHAVEMAVIVRVAPLGCDALALLCRHVAVTAPPTGLWRLRFGL